MLKKYKLENSRENEFESLVMEFNIKEYVIFEKRVDTLEECLKKCPYLDVIYNLVTDILDTKEKVSKDSPKIKYLLKKIPMLFKDYIEKDATSFDIEMIKSLSLDKKLNKYFFDVGFMYIFDNDNKLTLVLPKELQDIYNKVITSNTLKNLYQEKVTRCLFVYLLSNGYIPIDLMNDLIINYYNYKISPLEIKELALKTGIDIYNKYYILFSKESALDLLKVLEKKKNNFSYLRYSENEITNYFIYIIKFISDLGEILGNDINYIELILNMIFILYKDALEVLDEKLKNLDISKKEKIINLINENINNINIWSLNGRNYDEWYIEEVIKDRTIKLPDKNDLESCLKALGKEKIEKLKEDYEVDSLESLEDRTLDMFKDFLYEAELVELQPFFKPNIKAKALGNIDSTIYENLFFFQDKDDILLYLPKEYKDILNDIYYIKNIKEEKDYGQIISDFIEMNGIIENIDLKDILKEYYFINLSIKELNNIVKNCGYRIIKKKYYALAEYFDEKGLLSLFKYKKLFKYYKKISYNAISKTEEFEQEIYDYIENEFEGNNNIYEGIIINARLGALDRITINHIRIATGIEISEKQEKELINIYNKYKDYICCWLYNGYSVNEYEACKKKELN